MDLAIRLESISRVSPLLKISLSYSKLTNCVKKKQKQNKTKANKQNKTKQK